MIIGTKFPVAVHTLMIIAAFQGQQKITSDLIAESTGMNAVTIRNIFRSLKKAGLIQVKPGPGGTKLALEPDQITLYNIYSAVEDSDISDIFHIHQNSSQWCPVGRNVNDILAGPFEDITTMMHDKMNSVLLSDLLNELNKIEPQLQAPWS